MDHNLQWKFICGDGNNSLFWDYSLSWNTTAPRFTDCFQNTILIFIPCTFLWLFLPCKINSFRHSKSRLIPWTILNISKIVLNCILTLLPVINLFFIIKEDVYSSIYLIICIYQCLTFILANLIIYFDRKYGVQSSVYMFIHWLLLTCSGIFRCIHYISGIYNSEEKIEDFVIFLVYYPLVICQLILSTIKDAKPIYMSREEQDFGKNKNPCEKASFLSYLTLAWFDSLLWKGFRKQLKTSDVWDSVSSVKTNISVPLLEKTISSHSSKNKPLSIFCILCQTYWKNMLTIVAIIVLSDTCLFMNPIILKQFLRFIALDNPPIWQGFCIIAIMFICSLCQSFFLWHGMYLTQSTVCCVRSSLTSVIYRKCLTLSNSYKQQTTSGQMINLISVDVYRVVEFLDDVLTAVTFPFQIGVGLYMLYNLIGAAAFSGFGVMILLKLITALLARKQEVFETQQLQLKDERIKNLSEAISGVKVLKFFAWENPFMDRIGRIRQKETRAIKNCLVIEGITNLVWSFGPLLMNIAMFATYIFMDNKNVLDVEKIFITISIVYILQFPMLRLPMVIAGFIQARVSFKRINGYMNAKDLDPNAITRGTVDQDDAISVSNASFKWETSENEETSKANLQNISFRVGKENLVAVVGSVGSGKSTLLSALLGEIVKLCGSVNINGRVAYVSQQAWIQNATFKENILFGKPFNKRQYEKVIKCCDLEPDLAIMPGGDQAEIGEKGINLSGGQKQRISLARAVYDDADIYLFDDPLSAVDPHVGSHIFTNVIGSQGVLRRKTRVLVTHSLTYLPLVDKILVMSEGKITEMGTYKDLMDSSNGFAQYIATYRTGECASPPKFNRTESVKSETSVCEDLELDEGQLITSEHVQHGQVKSSVYKMYLKHVGYPVVALAVSLASVSFAFSASTEVWMSIWSMDTYSIPQNYTNEEELTDKIHENNLMRLGIYSLLAFCNGIFAGIFALSVVYGAMRACITFHKKLLHSILRSPMSFFDTTPSGRIVNRFSKDIEMVDGSLPMSFQNVLWGFLQIFESVIVICISLPVLVAVMVPVFFIYFFTQRFFARTLEQLRRFESVTRSPIYSRFSETLAGSSTLRAFQKENEFMKLFDDLIDENMKYVYHIKALFIWAGVRLDLVGNILTMLTAVFGLMQKDTLGAGTVALIVNYAVAIYYTFMWVVESSGSLESNIVSVERLNEYFDLSPEASWEKEEKKPDPSWPEEGEIEFHNYSTKYRQELPPVLNGISFKIDSCEKIGIIGRTGAGKSSVTLALFRMMEASEGSISIDNRDISEMGLHDLRSRLTVIPQDPVLFSGSLRMNLDPYNKYNDEQLWKALELAHLKDFVKQSNSGLDQDIAEGGSNLSVGQKQLVCLARALLKKTKILLLDEATAAVDSHTDSLIQSTIRSEFSDCTILTIAHRLNTIMDSTRLLVLNEGKVVALDEPSKLLDTLKSLGESENNL
ncbi:Multidrug resistance-associated protein 1 [Chamberlinius hualienensis]